MLSLRHPTLSYVSIHAPGRGATGLFTIRAKALFSFNSRTREGCDRETADLIDNLEGFNSRTREGCDQHGVEAGGQVPRVSIHAPGRGATAL